MPGPSGAMPQPSRTTRQTDGTLSPRRLDDGREVGDVERAAADERAVHVGQREQLGRVVGLDRAAVEDPGALGLVAVAVGHQRADEGDRVLGLLGVATSPVPMAQIGS